MTRLKCWKICPGQGQRGNVVILNPRMASRYLWVTPFPFQFMHCLPCHDVSGAWGFPASSLRNRNSGCAPYPTFWRRSPLRKNPYISATPGMLEPPAMIYKPEEHGWMAEITWESRNFRVVPSVNCWNMFRSKGLEGWWTNFWPYMEGSESES